MSSTVGVILYSGRLSNSSGSVGYSFSSSYGNEGSGNFSKEAGRGMRPSPCFRMAPVSPPVFFVVIQLVRDPGPMP